MLLDKVSAASSNGRALRVIGQHLVEILRREAAPLDLLMQDKLLRVNRSLNQITEFVTLFAHKNYQYTVCAGRLYGHLGGFLPRC
jgi:cysteinyl-tRNA synthetase